MNIDTLLARLDRAHTMGDHRWMACCPAHDDTSPPLSTRTVDDRVLIFCFAGCDPFDILAVVGLTWNDLFWDPWKASAVAAYHVQPKLPPVDPLALDKRIVQLALDDLSAGRELSLEDRAVAELAAERVKAVMPRELSNFEMSYEMPTIAPAAATVQHHYPDTDHFRCSIKRRFTQMDATEIWNGLANRFLWFVMERKKVVALPRGISEQVLESVANTVAPAIYAARTDPRFLTRMTDEGEQHWVSVYPELSKEYPGILGAMTVRAPAHTIRVALLYRCLDPKAQPGSGIMAHHVESARALVQYHVESCRYIIGDASVDPLANRIIERLRTVGAMTRDQLNKALGYHHTAARIDVALDTLRREGRIKTEKQQTGGRPREVIGLTDLP